MGRIGLGIVELRGIELRGDVVVCRVERKETTHTASGLEHYLPIRLVKEGKIKRLIVVVDRRGQPSKTQCTRLISRGHPIRFV